MIKSKASSFSLLHTEWSSGWGGQEIRILAESLAFKNRGISVKIAAQPNGQLIDRARNAGIEVFPVHMHKGLNISAIWQLINIIKNEQINIVHTHSSVDHRLAGIAARISGCSVVRSRHLSTPISRSPFSKALYMKLADYVITSGESIRQAMISNNGMSGDQIVSIPAGIDTKQFSLNREMADIRSLYNISKDTFVVGIVGVLRSWKGHADLIDAVKRISDQIPKLKLIIVGEGPQRQAIENQIRALNLIEMVMLTGHQKDPAPFMKAMDVVVLTSYANEATSQVLPQAMAMRRPVISSNIGSLQEVVINEVTGLTFPPRDIHSLAKALLRFYTNKKLRYKLADSGYSHVQTNFTFDQMIKNTEKVYRKLLAIKNPSL